MRMEFTGLKRMYTDKQFVDRVFNNRPCRTMRPAWEMLNWHGKLLGASKTEAKTLTKMSPTQIQTNTTRGSTPGLTNPNIPEGPNNFRVPVPVFKGTKGRNVGLRANNGAAGRNLPRANASNRSKTAIDTPVGSSNPLLAPGSGSLGSGCRPLPSSTSAQSSNSKLGQARHADPRDIYGSTSDPLGDQFTAPPAEHLKKNARRPAPSDDEDITIGSKPSYPIPQNPYASAGGDPAQDFTSRLPTSIEESTNWWNMAQNTLSPNPYAPGHTTRPTSPARQPQPTSCTRLGGYYRHTDSYMRSPSPSICPDCGQNDPQVQHILYGCPTGQSAMPTTLPQTTAASGNSRYPDFNPSVAHGQTSEWWSASGDTSVSVSLLSIF